MAMAAAFAGWAGGGRGCGEERATQHAWRPACRWMCSGRQVFRPGARRCSGNCCAPSGSGSTGRPAKGRQQSTDQHRTYSEAWRNGGARRLPIRCFQEYPARAVAYSAIQVSLFGGPAWTQGRFRLVQAPLRNWAVRSMPVSKQATLRRPIAWGSQGPNNDVQGFL